MDGKKISFGFSKVAKKPTILPSKTLKEETKVELIKCLEGKEIMLVVEKQEAAPLVIQIPNMQKTSTALASLMKRRAVLLGEDEAEPEEEGTTAEAQSIADVTGGNLEQRAARELLAAAQANGDGDTLNSEKLVLPALKADELPLDGAKEATLDDYDSIPIQQFGLAMLRGMGWVDPPPASKKKGAAPVDEAPFLRPKGMGLGADKALKPKALLVQPERNELLEIKKQAFVRILGGKQKDQYGQIEGFDDHAGRVIVKMAIGGAKEAFNEFLCQPVSRKEYAQYGKCINTAKYEEFKKHENEHGQIIINREKSAERNNVKTDSRKRDDERRERQRDDERRDRQREEECHDRRRDDEHRDKHREEERKTYRTKDEERRPYKTEQRSNKLEERRTESRDYKEERTSFKQEERKPYKIEEKRREQQESHGSSSTSKSSSRRRQQSSSDEAEDTGESTESDSDSAYERKNKKKSKKKKSKKSKSKSHRHRRSSSSCDDSVSSDDERSRRRHPSKHKKKTKKSKHARSRTRSRSREGRGR